ncbi:MAG TPA: hypothetical protein VMH06_02355 [Thermodesulfovibrionales bacterium]|nr:hypothetical protein [Thermodesulfovibrionales bacterium]
MIKIKCPVCGSDSYYRSTSLDIIRLVEGGVAALQCGDEVRALGRPVQKDPDAPYVELEVFGERREEGEKDSA